MKGPSLFHPRPGLAVLLRWAGGAWVAGICGAGAWAAAGPLSIVAPAQALAPEIKTPAEVKSFYLINFARFVDWPAGAFASPEAPLTIGILGRDPLGKSLQAFEGKTIKGHPVRILKSRDIRDLTGCQVLYISDSEEDDLIHVFRTLKSKPILTMGETEGFQAHGGMVRFREEEGRIKIGVNRKAIQASNLVVNSRLLAITTPMD